MIPEYYIFDKPVKIKGKTGFGKLRFKAYIKKGKLLKELKPKNKKLELCVKRRKIFLPRLDVPVLLTFFKGNYLEAKKFYIIELEDTINVTEIDLRKAEKGRQEDYPKPTLDENFENHMAKGKHYYKEKNYEKAISNFKKATGENEKSAEALYWLALAKFKGEELYEEKGIKPKDRMIYHRPEWNIDASIKLDKSNFKAYELKGDIQTRDADYKEDAYMDDKICGYNAAKQLYKTALKLAKKQTARKENLRKLEGKIESLGVLEKGDILVKETTEKGERGIVGRVLAGKNIVIGKTHGAGASIGTPILDNSIVIGKTTGEHAIIGYCSEDEIDYEPIGYDNLVIGKTMGEGADIGWDMKGHSVVIRKTEADVERNWWYRQKVPIIMGFNRNEFIINHLGLVLVRQKPSDFSETVKKLSKLLDLDFLNDKFFKKHTGLYSGKNPVQFLKENGVHEKLCEIIITAEEILKEKKIDKKFWEKTFEKHKKRLEIPWTKKSMLESATREGEKKKEENEPARELLIELEKAEEHALRGENKKALQLLGKIKERIISADNLYKIDYYLTKALAHTQTLVEVTGKTVEKHKKSLIDSIKQLDTTAEKLYQEIQTNLEFVGGEEKQLEAQKEIREAERAGTKKVLNLAELIEIKEDDDKVLNRAYVDLRKKAVEVMIQKLDVGRKLRDTMYCYIKVFRKNVDMMSKINKTIEKGQLEKAQQDTKKAMKTAEEYQKELNKEEKRKQAWRKKIREEGKKNKKEKKPKKKEASSKKVRKRVVAKNPYENMV